MTMRFKHPLMLLSWRRDTTVLQLTGAAISSASRLCVTGVCSNRTEQKRPDDASLQGVLQQDWAEKARWKMNGTDIRRWLRWKRDFFPSTRCLEEKSRIFSRAVWETLKKAAFSLNVNFIACFAVRVDFGAKWRTKNWNSSSILKDDCHETLTAMFLAEYIYTKILHHKRINITIGYMTYQINMRKLFKCSIPISKLACGNMNSNPSNATTHGSGFRSLFRTSYFAFCENLKLTFKYIVTVSYFYYVQHNHRDERAVISWGELKTGTVLETLSSLLIFSYESSPFFR